MCDFSGSVHPLRLIVEIDLSWSALSPLANLQRLILSENVLSGNLFSLCSNQFTFPQFDWLYLDTNLLDGSLPDISACIPYLSILVLSHNFISGSLVDWQLPNLIILELWGNQMTGSVIDFSGLMSLHKLYLSHN